MRIYMTLLATGCGAVTFGIGLTATLGYACQMVRLYWWTPHTGPAMATNTAIAFCLSGLGLTLFGVSRLLGVKK